MRHVTAALVLAAAAWGCSAAVTGPSELQGTTWRLVSLSPETGPPTIVANPERYTLAFVDDRVSIRTDCNVCNGTFALAGDTLTIDRLACTRAFCGPQSLEGPYLDALADPLNASRDQSLLVLRGTRTTLRFRAH
jgi:heat shock protein HslJ